MRRMGRSEKGSLTVEACISYTAFMLVVLTILLIIRIIYTYGLIQHAACQTVKELAMYSYLYEVSGLDDISQNISAGAAGNNQSLNKDAGAVVSIYEKLCTGNFEVEPDLNSLKKDDPMDYLKELGGALAYSANEEVINSAFNLAARALMSTYLSADSQNQGADRKLRKLNVIGGMNGLNLESSSYFSGDNRIDLVVCYTLKPSLPINIMPEMNLVNRASIRAMSGSSIFTGETKEKEQNESIWDMQDKLERGRAIQRLIGKRNLPDRFKTFSYFDKSTGTAAAVHSIDIRDKSYQSEKDIARALRGHCKDVKEFKEYSLSGTSLSEKDIKKRELIICIPADTEDRTIDKTKFFNALQSVKAEYPDINITYEEIE